MSAQIEEPLHWTVFGERCIGCRKPFSLQLRRKGRHHCRGIVKMAYVDMICQCHHCHPEDAERLLHALCTEPSCSARVVGPHLHHRPAP